MHVHAASKSYQALHDLYLRMYGVSTDVCCGAVRDLDLPATGMTI